jgi:hypothetical protein
MKTVPDLRFGGLFIAAVAAGALLGFGIELLVTTLREPLVAMIVEAINSIIHAGRFDVVLLAPYRFSWAIASYTGLGAIIALLAGLWLGAWAHRTDSSQP